MNYDGQPIEAAFSAAVHEDLASDALWDPQAVTAERERLQAIWEVKKPLIQNTFTTLTGPSYKMAVLIKLLHQYPERALTGTDYVASYGMHTDYPGYTPRTGAPLSPLTGCHKTEQSHAEQLTDTSSLNMFWDDETFSAIVLGGNFFRVAGIATTFAPPPICRADDTKPAALAQQRAAGMAAAVALPAAQAEPRKSDWALTALVCAIVAVGFVGWRVVGRREPADPAAYEQWAPAH